MAILFYDYQYVKYIYDRLSAVITRIYIPSRTIIFSQRQEPPLIMVYQDDEHRIDLFLYKRSMNYRAIASIVVG